MRLWRKIRIPVRLPGRNPVFAKGSVLFDGSMEAFCQAYAKDEAMDMDGQGNVQGFYELVKDTVHAAADDMAEKREVEA